MLILNSYFLAPTSPYTTSPSDYAGLIRWHKADAILGLNDGDPISSWLDSSVTNDPAVTIGSDLPVYKTGIYNGQPTARNGQLQFTEQTLGDFTIIGIAYANTDSLLLGHNTINTQVRIYRGSADVLSFYANHTTETISDELPGVHTDLRMLTWYRSGFFTEFRCNNTAVAPVTGFDDTSALIQRIGSNPFLGPFVGDIAEICVYDNVLSPTDLSNLFIGYFQVKYGL